MAKEKNGIMTADEVKDLKEAGHVIGNPSLRLSEGHNMDDLKEWEQWAFELKLKNEFRNGNEQSVPYEAQANKLLKKGIRASQRTIMEQNHMVDYRLVASPNYSNYYVPAGKVKAGDMIECSLYVQVQGKGVNETKHDRILFAGLEEATKE